MQDTRVAAVRETTCDRVAIFDDGREAGSICASEAPARGLTVIDLADSWTPSLFAPADNHFHTRYIEIAQERDRDPHDALAELYGVVPAFSVVRARLADTARHACNAELDMSPVQAVTRRLSQETGKRLKPDEKAAVAAIERRLVCEGYLAEKFTGKGFNWRIGDALEMFQRRNFLMPNGVLDDETREALQLDSRELDFRLALRILRERVADAAALVEDGTAGEGPQPVLGRFLDPEAMRSARGHKPMADAAPDLISLATETAARDLGWATPEDVLAFLERNRDRRIAIALPPAPAWHSPHMELSAVIDRGDVHYDEMPPPVRRFEKHRPTLVIYAHHEGRKIPLVKWPTTIGGWADERLAGGFVVQRWKESDVGPRVWRDLYAAPTWLPPKTTPDRDLVKNLYNGHWALKSDVFGPGPHAAYGMMLLVHHELVKTKKGERFDDNGIGTHGTASVTSVVNGTSHGCHRMYNQLAVRLGDFLLRHRTHEVKGEEKVAYRRIVNHKGETFKAKVDTRGYRYELTPPVPVEVTRGNILTARKTPPKLIAPAKP